MIKDADQILGPALDRFYELRPNAFKHINLRTGVYWQVFAAQRAMLALSLKRVTQLVNSNRLTAKGQELRDFVASEFTALPVNTGTPSVGTVVFSRPAGIKAGVIPAGSVIDRQADLQADIPWTSARYETITPVYMGAGVLVSPPVPIRALTPGSAANHALRTDAFTQTVVPSGTPLFDTTITVASFEAAGGSDLPSDEYVRKFAKASSTGQFGPTAAATVYGALSAAGVRNVLVYDDPVKKAQVALIADESWASSARWASVVQQSLYDADLVGFGCKVIVLPVKNKIVSVAASVILRDSGYLSDTVAVEKAIGDSIRSYFDDRPDWNVWKTRGLKSAITRAHSKILKCDTVVVTDIAGNVLPQITNVNYQIEQFHYYVGGSVSLTFVGPS